MNSALPEATTPQPEKLAAILQQEDYAQKRLQTVWSEMDCLVNKDLREAILVLCEGQKGRLLDFGCGGSPYAGILPQFRPYVRADIFPGEGIDLIINEAGALPGEPSGSYDVVFSTQVLEHVPDTRSYLAEAYRLLRPGGILILTTHGLMQEHGCPNDFYRWTGEGLERTVREAGFVVQESYKLTVGLRAASYLLNYIVFSVLMFDERKILGQIARAFRSLYRNFLVQWVNRLGDRLTHLSRAPGRSTKEMLYIGVALRAVKPDKPNAS